MYIRISHKIFILLILFLSTSIFVFGQKINKIDLHKLYVMSDKGHTDKAIKKLNNYRKNVSKQDSLYIFIALTSSYLNMAAFNCEEAIKDNEEIIQLDSTKEIDCQMYIALYKKYMGDFDGAINANKRLLQIDSTSMIVYNNLASAYNSAGKFQEAINILSLNPNSERMQTEYYHFAYAYFNLNKIDSAKYWMEIFMTKEPALNDFLAYKLLAQIYFTLGDTLKSCSYINKANSLIKTSKQEKQIHNKSSKVQEYYIFKMLIKEIEDTKRLKLLYCKE